MRSFHFNVVISTAITQRYKWKDTFHFVSMSLFANYRARNELTTNNVSVTAFTLTLAKRTRIIRNTRDSNDGDFDVEIESRNLHDLFVKKMIMYGTCQYRGSARGRRY